MTIEIYVPDIGTDVVEVTEILVNLGDSVKEEDSLITVEGDKASMEVPAPKAGVVKQISVSVGDKVETGSLIMLFATEEQTETPAVAPAQIDAKISSELKDVYVLDIGTDEVEVTEIMVSIGDKIAPEQSLLTVEGDKASMEIPAPFAGTVKELKVAVGDKVATNSLIMVFEVQVEEQIPVKADSSKYTEPEVKGKFIKSAPSLPEKMPSDFDELTQSDAYVHASPIVRRLAREFGINLSKVQGTGHKNRIQKADLQQYVKEVITTVEAGATNSGSTLGLLPWPDIDFTKFGEIETKPLSKIKKISGANLARNWAMIPHVTQFDDVDITELEAFRQEQNALEAKKGSGIKITPLVFIMKAVAKALLEFPHFNASLSTDGESLIVKKYINIGVAVDTPNGLVVPVIKSVDSKGIHALSVELNEASGKARAGKLMTGDMQGGCFSISSLGGIGGSAFTPIVNAPEVAILGVSKAQMKPVWNGKKFIPRLQLPLSLSYDHRVIDGAEGARFITYLNQCLSDIRRLVL